MGIRESDIAAVRAATDLVKLISEHTTVKRVGRSWMARCPMHGERTPSLSISPDKGVYYCFGCQRSGDAITFVREIEGLDFAAAVERLAAAAGIVVEHTAKDDAKRTRRRKLLEAVDAAAGFYHDKLLNSRDAEAAREYLAGRGIGTDTIVRHRLGWAPDGWDVLVSHLDLQGRDLADSGLGFINRADRRQDFFRARVMFPVCDERGAAVGFGGRVLPGAEGPKYINTPASCVVYDKSRVLYGLHTHRREIVRAAEAVVCEGYTDVIAASEAGAATAVATCGTALTEDHIKLLKRFSVERLVLAFDADSGGEQAAGRLHAWEDRYAVRMTVAVLPEGSDPDDYARSNPDGFMAAVNEPVEMLRWQIERSLAHADLSGIGSRAAAARAAARLVAAHPDPLVRDPYLVEIAERCSVEIRELRRTTGQDTDTDAPDAADATDAAAEPPAVTQAESEALRLAVHHPEQAAGWLQPELFCDPVCAEAYRRLRDAGGDIPAAIDGCSPPAARLLAFVAADADSGDRGDVEGVMAAAARLAADRAVRTLTASAKAASSPDAARGYVECVTWIKQQVALLADRHPARRDALDVLLPWLVEYQHSLAVSAS